MISTAPRPQQTTRPLVQVTDLTCGYDGQTVLEDISLDLHPGQFVGIVGPSGSGKTTLLRALLGRADVYHGAVHLGGDSVERVTRIGYVPQLETIDWTYPVTAEEVVLMGLTAEGGLWPWPSRQHRRQMAELLERSPQLLLLDEPTASADIKTRHEILHLLADLNADGVTVVLTTHDLNSVA